MQRGHHPKPYDKELYCRNESTPNLKKMENERKRSHINITSLENHESRNQDWHHKFIEVAALTIQHGRGSAQRRKHDAHRCPEWK
jgi:hypothetical protein